MPVSVVVGGQYGSEGKGKVALQLVRDDPTITTVVRPGGTNSGHTAYGKQGRRQVLRQLPAAAIDGNVKIVLPAGSYVDTHQLQAEITQSGINPAQIVIDPRANVIRKEHVEWEREAKLIETIGSTGSGTGAAVLSRIGRFAPHLPSAIQAGEVPELLPYIGDASGVVEAALKAGERVLIEGTQGFGLSPLHGDAWPKCTSRDTTAAAFLSEAGIAPSHVDQVHLVLRCHPIRVAGDSGPLAGETTWRAIAVAAGSDSDFQEYTSVTHKLRRVGVFDPRMVCRAIAANAPTSIILNHLDYVDAECAGSNRLTRKALEFVQYVEQSINRSVDFFGTDGRTVHAFSPAIA